MEAHIDQKYINALLNHESALIEEIYQKCSLQCIRFVKKNSGNLSEAQDLFQETIVSLYQKAKAGLVLSAPICAYLYPVYKSKWFNYINKKKRRQEQFNLRNDDKNGYIDKAIYSSMDEKSTEEIKDEILLDCFKKLPPDIKELFDLRYKQKLSSKEIAKKLNIEDNTVNQRFSYYKQKLKDCTENHPDFKKL